MTKQIIEQYLTFWFSINNQMISDIDPSDETASDKSYSLFAEVDKILAEKEDSHPKKFRLVKSTTNREDDMDVERWTYCEQDPSFYDRKGFVAWAVEFYSETEFTDDVINDLRTICQDAFSEVSSMHEIPVSYIDAEVKTKYEVSETKVLA